MGTPATEIADFIQQYVKQKETSSTACVRSTGEKGYHSVESGARHHFVIGLVIDLDDKTVQMQITKGHHYQALALVSMTMGNLKSQMFCNSAAVGNRCLHHGTTVCECSLQYVISGVQTCTSASQADLSACL